MRWTIWRSPFCTTTPTTPTIRTTPTTTICTPPPTSPSTTTTRRLVAWVALVPARRGPASVLQLAEETAGAALPQVVEIKHGDGDTTDQFVWGPAYVDELLLHERDADRNTGGLEIFASVPHPTGLTTNPAGTRPLQLGYRSKAASLFFQDCVTDQLTTNRGKTREIGARTKKAADSQTAASEELNPTAGDGIRTHDVQLGKLAFSR